MRSLFASIVAGLLVSSPLYVAAQSNVNTYRPNTCPGTPVTTVAVSTVTTVITTVYTTARVTTVPTTTTIPHSCYTQLISTPRDCGPIYCPPAPACVIFTTSTQPCRDTCCPYTSTITTPGACKTCQTGCATSTSYVPQTSGCVTYY